MKRWLLLSQLMMVELAIADGATGGAAAAGPHDAFKPFLPLIIIFGIFYFLILRPQQKKTKEHQKFVTELKRGEMVVTNSGIIGTIKNISDKFITLEVDQGVCIKMLKTQVLESANALKDEDSRKTVH